MIDYSKTQNTLQALCLMFPKLRKNIIRKSLLSNKDNKTKTEKELVEYITQLSKITYLTKRNNDR